MQLYRIISLETFIDLLHNKRERYVRPNSWEDIYEGFLYSQIYNPKQRKLIIEEMYDNVCNTNFKITIDNILKLDNAYRYVYGQCWSMLSDSDALWRIYSYGKHSIQIISSDEKIKNMILQNKNKDEVGVDAYQLEKVEYDVNPEEDLIMQQIRMLAKNKKVMELFFHKRKAFVHEAEYRMLVECSYGGLALGAKSKSANLKAPNIETMRKEQIIEEVDNRLTKIIGNIVNARIDQNKYLSVENLNEYIISVKVNPFAEDWYVDLIKGLCAEYNVHFEGKSKLYMGC